MKRTSTLVLLLVQLAIARGAQLRGCCADSFCVCDGDEERLRAGMPLLRKIEVEQFNNTVLLKNDDDGDAANICQKDLAKIFPTRARNVRGEWKLVVQMDDPRTGSLFLQPVYRFTSCWVAGRLDDLDVPQSVQFHCKLRNVSLQLLTYDEAANILVADWFSAPLACDLHTN